MVVGHCLGAPEDWYSKLMPSQQVPIRPNVLQMVPYSPGKPIEEVRRELGLERIVKLASNENPLGPSPKALEAIAKAAQSLHLYPDGAAFELREAICNKFSVKPEQILLGNGSDELLLLLGLVFLGSAEDQIVVGNPSFSRYDATAELAAGQVVRIPLTSDYRHDLPAMLAAVNDKTKMVFVANPNNPTGTIVTRAEFEDFISRLPSHVVCVLDEAYYEFACSAPDYPNGLDYLSRYPNIVALRTFSKAYGLAGIRIGYGFASAEVVDAVNRARAPFNTNALAQAAAVAALGDTEHLANSVKVNEQGRKQIEEALEAVGARPIRSYGNFVFADLGRSGREMFNLLLHKGVVTRPGDIFGCPSFLRISIGTQEEIAFFAEALRKVW